MRQAGYLAAAGIYALDHHVDRLKIDNDRAKMLGEVLKSCHYVSDVRPVASNIVIFDVKPPYDGSSFVEKLSLKDIHAVPFGPQTVRFVTHLDLSEAMIERTIEVLQELNT